jgi:hypothetical protein
MYSSGLYRLPSYLLMIIFSLTFIIVAALVITQVMMSMFWICIDLAPVVIRNNEHKKTLYFS